MLAISCQQQEESLIREETDLLHRAGFRIGIATNRELAAGNFEFTIELSSTSEGLDQPAHFISEPGELVSKLSPVIGATGRSITILDHLVLAIGEVLGFDLLLEMDGSITTCRGH